MGNILDILEDFFSMTEEKANEKVENITSQFDLTTDEDYSRYMEFLGDLRIKAQKHNNVLKLIIGEDVGDLIDRIAQDATDKHLEAKTEKDREIKFTQAKESENKNDSKFDIHEDHKASDNECPSTEISDKEYESICRIVRNYIDNNIVINEEFDQDMCDALEAELLEYTCWLYNKNNF